MIKDPQYNFDRQREVLKKVNALLHEGKVRASHEAFREGMEAQLPDYPLRFSIVLKSVDTEVLKQYLATRNNQDNSFPALSLDDNVVKWDEQKIGKVPSSAQKIIDGLVLMQDLYGVRFLEAKWEDDKLLFFAIEVSRPELYFDEQGNLYSPDTSTGPHKPSDQGAEAPPILLQNKLEELLARDRGESQKYPRGHDGSFKGLDN